jgi:hypothetical protein
MGMIRKLLIMFGNLFDPGWYADKINTKLGVYEWTKKSRFRKWQEGLTGWKFWTWQIVGGITFVVIMEFVLNKIGLTMLPW